MLGKNASRVQKVVSEVVDEIKEENVTIDNTEKEFNIIEDNIKVLNRYILEIIDRVKNVVEFSNNIEGNYKIKLIKRVKYIFCRLSFSVSFLK